MNSHSAFKFFIIMEELTLRHHPRVYFDGLGNEFNRIPNDEKLEELSELIESGFDLFKAVMQYKKDRDLIYKEAVKPTFVGYIIYMRTGEWIDGILEDILLINLTEKAVIQLFIDELLLRTIQNKPAYQRKYVINIGEWNLDEIVKYLNGKYDKYEVKKLGRKEFISICISKDWTENLINKL